MKSYFTHIGSQNYLINKIIENCREKKVCNMHIYSKMFAVIELCVESLQFLDLSYKHYQAKRDDIFFKPGYNLVLTVCLFDQN